MYSVTLLFENDLPYLNFSELFDAITKKTLSIHTGITITSLGNSLVKVPKVIYDKYPNNVKYVANGLGSGKYYWSVASIYDCEEKSFSEWSQEQLLIVP
jgi:hypothetical protein